MGYNCVYHIYNIIYNFTTFEKQKIDKFLKYVYIIRSVLKQYIIESKKIKLKEKTIKDIKLTTDELAYYKDLLFNRKIEYNFYNPFNILLFLLILL